MIKHTDYIKVLQMLLKAYNNSLMPAYKGITKPANIHLIDKIQQEITNKKFVQINHTDEGMTLKFETNENLFLIKKTDFGKTDPPLYFEDDGKWELDFKTSSVIFLTDFARFLYQHAAHRMVQQDLKKYFPLLKDNFELICKDIDCFSEIWWNAEMDCFALTDKVEGKIYYVTNSATNNDKLSKRFPAAPEKKTKKKTPVFVSDFLQNAYVEDTALHANVKLDGQTDLIEVIFDVNKKKTDFSKEAAFCQKILNKLSLRKQEQLLKLTAEEVTVAAFSQSEKINDEQEQIDHLKNDLKFFQLIFTEDSILLNLLSNKLFPNKEITVQVDDELNIVDMTVS